MLARLGSFKTLAFAAALALAFTASACSDDATNKDGGVNKDGATDTVKADTTTDVIPDTTADTVKPDGLPDGAGACSLLGKWKHEVFNGYYTFNADLSMEFEFIGQVYKGGSYTFDGKTLKMKVAPCPTDEATFEVTFKTNCTQYVFKKINDPCGPRTGLDGATFTKQ